MKLESLTQPIVYSQMEGSPPLWITHRRDMLNNEDVFVNNAKIDKKDSDYSGKNSKNQVQVRGRASLVLGAAVLPPCCRAVVRPWCAAEFSSKLLAVPCCRGCA